jgi:hypothetical protein
MLLLGVTAGGERSGRWMVLGRMDRMGWETAMGDGGGGGLKDIL